MASVKVAVRVRPLNRRENDMRCSTIIQMEGQKTFITNVRLPSMGTSPGCDTLGRERVKQFTYDYSYWSADPSDKHYVSQEQVFTDLGYDVVKSAYEGYNACIFAYGQTGSGKTYTMMGDTDSLGLIPRICESLFCEMTDPDTSYRTEVSYLEIYNEKVRDLLRDKKLPQANLRVREHPKDGPYVQDLSKHLVMNYHDIEELIVRGNSIRTTAATNMNDHSSRSHAIFTIVFTQAKFIDGIPSEIHSKTHLVDLAGSERADASGASGDRLKEGGSINKSLVTLGHCISRLADLSDKFYGSPKRAIFIPYRDSVLTWLLKDSLGGNSKTIMIATVSPADCNYAETLSTLRYASRAKKIVNKPTVNEDPNVKLIRELREENARLRALLGKSVNVLPSVKDFIETKEKLDRNEAKVKQLTETWTDKWSEAAYVLEEHNALALRREGTGVVLDSDLPYLLAIDDNILSTGMRLYHLKEGDTKVGSSKATRPQDIVLTGPFIEPQHCIFQHRNGDVVLVPLEGALCSVNNVRVHEVTKLSQGSIIRLGRHHIFRFNHPGEAAKLRQQLQDDGQSDMIKVWQDFQWSWSTLSVTDSAVGSDMTKSEISFASVSSDDQTSLPTVSDKLSDQEKQDKEKLVPSPDYKHASSLPASLDFDQRSRSSQSREDLEAERLEEKRRELEQLEEAHCLAEAQRLAQLAEQEAEREKLKQKEEELKSIAREAKSMKAKADKAKEEIHNLSSAVEETIVHHLRNKEKLKTEEELLKRQREKLEQDKAKAREERQKLRRKRELERAKLDLERERQQAQAEQFQIEEERLEHEKAKLIDSIEKEQAHIHKMRDVEKAIYHKSMAEMRDLVEDEVWHMAEMVGISSIDLNPPKEQLSLLDDLDELDLDDLRFKINVIDGPVVPLQYLQSNDNKDSNEVRDEGMKLASSLSEISLKDLKPGDINSHLAYLADHVHDIHIKVCEALQRKYSSVLSCDDTTSGLGQQVIEQFAKIRPLFEQLEKMAGDEVSKKTLEDKLADYDRVLTIVDRLLQAHELLKCVDKGIKNKRFLASIENLDAVHNLLSRLDVEEDLERNVQKVLQTEVCILRERLLYELSETWNRMLKWTLPPDSRKDADRPRTVTFEVTDSESDKDILSSVVQAMQSVNMLDLRIRKLCDNFMEYIVKSVVMDRNTLLQVIDELEKYTLCVVINPAGQSRRLLVPPGEAFQKLEQVFTFLHRPLAHIAVSEIQASTGEMQQVLLVEKIGRKITKSLFECIYNECLSHAIPQNNTGSNQWEKYNETIRLTEQFQDMLTSLKFLCGQQTTLMDYLNNVNTLFANIKSQEILKKAHEFMTQELMSSIQISAEHPLGPPRNQDEKDREKFVQGCREEAGTSHYKLPTCQISVPVRSLMCLAYDTLQEAVTGSNEGAVNLCHSVSNMFELYCDVVPAYHQEKLRTLHLMAALHHNNCMFVAHHLMTLDKTFRAKLIASSHPAAKDASLADLVPKVRRLGNDDFTDHISVKKEQLCDHISGAQGNKLVGFACIADDSGEGATRAVKQMLHHLKHISAIWRDVLPTNVYCRGIGTLLDAAVSEIIDCVLAIEEFSADDCEYLQRVLSEIIEFGAEYFCLDDPKVNPQVALHEFVPSWMKFKELVIILNSNLQEVYDRWADGKGPLAMHFTGDEVKRLVIAMFENTSRRAALLQQLTRRPSVHLS